MTKLRIGSILGPSHRGLNHHEPDEASSSLFPSAGETLPTVVNSSPDSMQPAVFPRDDDGPTKSERDRLHDSSSQLREDAPKAEDLAFALPILLAIALCFLLWQIKVCLRNDAEFREESRTIQAAEAREKRRSKQEWKKERAKEIEKVLVSKTASECSFSLSTKNSVPISNSSIHANVAIDTSNSCSSHDVDSPATNNEDLDEESTRQICAICLEPYIGGKDKVSWSKIQTCRHAFHHQCIQDWLEENRDGNCPCCRGSYLNENAEATREIGDTLNVEETEQHEGSIVDGRSDDENDSGNSHVILDEESNGGESQAVSDVPQLDREIPIDSTIASPMAKGNVCSIKLRTDLAVSEFTSFCIVHGLQRDVKCGNDDLSRSTLC